MNSLIISFILLLIPKTRKVGIMSMLALGLSGLFVNCVIKNLVARPRPFTQIEGLTYLIKRPRDYSFPSGHTSASFAAAVVFLRKMPKRYGIPFMVLAVLIALARLYLGVHYPTDVLGGAIIGMLIAFLAMWIYDLTHNYVLIFSLSLLCASVGFAINSTLKLKPREQIKNASKISLDRFFLLQAWREAVSMICFAFSYGVLSTYIAIYGKERLNITGGTGVFFLLLSLGLILSRLAGNKTLKKGMIVRNASFGIVLSLIGYCLFSSVHNFFGYYGAALIIGLGNGHMFPAFQTMFINLAPHTRRGTATSSLLISWDVGVGLGIMIGGMLVGQFGYYSAFWASSLVNLIGVIFFFAVVKSNYQKHKLR